MALKGVSEGFQGAFRKVVYGFRSVSSKSLSGFRGKLVKALCKPIRNTAKDH